MWPNLVWCGMVVRFLEVEVAQTSSHWSVYALEDPRHPGVVRYVGVTHKRPKYRLRDHVTGALRGKSNYHSMAWIRSLLSKGIEPSLRILQEGDGEGWIEAEVYWIRWHRDNNFDLTNHTDGGEGAWGCIPSPQARLKMSLAKKGKRRSPDAVSKMKATMSTPEYRAHHSEVHKGKTQSPESRAKQVQALRGRKQTEEHVARRAAANTGKKRSPEICAMFSQIRTGQKDSPETVLKRAASNRGKKRSAEFKERMSVIARTNGYKPPRRKR
jgi:hypothetical protein